MSVLIAIKSTLLILSVIIRLIAAPPPPPIPQTLILANVSISGFTSAIQKVFKAFVFLFLLNTFFRQFYAQLCKNRIHCRSQKKSCQIKKYTNHPQGLYMLLVKKSLLWMQGLKPLSKTTCHLFD